MEKGGQEWRGGRGGMEGGGGRGIEVAVCDVAPYVAFIR